jgi:DNA-binding response OmpR family regulator
VVSAQSDLASRMKAFEAGVDYFIAKPWDISDIRRILETIQSKSKKSSASGPSAA